MFDVSYRNSSNSNSIELCMGGVGEGKINFSLLKQSVDQSVEQQSKPQYLHCLSFTTYETNVPILLVGLKNNEKAWPNKGHPFGTTVLNVKLLDSPRNYSTIESYREDIKNSIENWLNK